MCPAVGDAARVERRHTWVPPYRGELGGGGESSGVEPCPYA